MSKICSQLSLLICAGTIAQQSHTETVGPHRPACPACVTVLTILPRVRPERDSLSVSTFEGRCATGG